MIIPSTYKLNKTIININIDDDECTEAGAYGLYYHQDKLIVLCNKFMGKPLSKKVKEQSLTHELIHSILDEMGEDRLNKNEKFVDDFAILLHQAFKTMK
jgi:hypothetical protein